MSINDYISLVSEYIFNKVGMLGHISSNFYIQYDEDIYTKEKYCEVKELNNGKQLFYLKFPCNSKEEFYSVVFNSFIKRFKNNDLVMYTAINYNFNKYFSVVNKNATSVIFQINDEIDIKVFNRFKDYLDNYTNEIDVDINSVTLEKIML